MIPWHFSLPNPSKIFVLTPCTKRWQTNPLKVGFDLVKNIVPFSILCVSVVSWALSNSVKRLGHFCFANVCIPQIHFKTVFCVNRHQAVTRIRCNWSHFNLFCVVYCVLLCVSVLCPLSKSPEYLWAHTATFPPAPEKNKVSKSKNRDWGWGSWEAGRLWKERLWYFLLLPLVLV